MFFTVNKIFVFCNSVTEVDTDENYNILTFQFLQIVSSSIRETFDILGKSET
jgi:hypothetical protein